MNLRAHLPIPVGDRVRGRWPAASVSLPLASGPSRQSAFTMVEIALCLAIVGFAMVAIIGVMPMGLQVQKTNRDDTIINQEGAFLLESIRNGSMGLDMLTNNVDWISTNLPPGVTSQVRSNFTTGREIVGLLSTPKYYNDPARKLIASNTVVAKFRAMSGAAASQSTSASARDFAFSYLVQSEVIPHFAYPPGFVSTNWTSAKLPTGELLARQNLWAEGINLQNHLYEVRLTLRWPVFEQRTAAGVSYRTGPNQKIFRTLVGGLLVPYAFTPSGQAAAQTLYLFTPSVY